MLRLTIDGQTATAAPGETILAVARRLGVDIPALCFHPDLAPAVSCMVCVVKISGSNRLTPACATSVADGMTVESNAPEAREAQRAALALLLGEHVGECVAPCVRACPAQVDIPFLMRAITEDYPERAYVHLRERLGLPEIVSRLCHEPCRKACRRTINGEALAVRALERRIEESFPVAESPAVSTGKRAALVGGGLAGLVAAARLARAGVACEIFEQTEQTGEKLRQKHSPQVLPSEVLRQELERLSQLGVIFHLGETVGAKRNVMELRSEFDAVLIACGFQAPEALLRLGLRMEKERPRIDPQTFVAEADGIFAAGEIVRENARPIRVVAEAIVAAENMLRFFQGQPPRKFGGIYSTVLPRVCGTENRSADAACLLPDEGGDSDAARREAARCLLCGCVKADDCRLRKYAALCQANPVGRKGLTPTPTTKPNMEALADVTCEPEKCVRCGLCVRVAEKHGVTPGLTFLGRGFDVKIGAPPNAAMSAGLTGIAGESADACPTAAITRRTNRKKTPS
jgi:ferredoxin